MGEVSSKLKDIKTKRDKYAVLNIESILQRVSQKPNLDLEEKIYWKKKTF